MLCAHPARLVLRARFKDLFGRRPVLQSPGSRRGVAPCRLGAPPAASFSPALPCGCHRPTGPGCAPLRAAPSAACTAPVRPGGAPSLPPGQAGRPLRGDRPAPPVFGASPLPGPGRPHCVRTAGPRALRPSPRPRKSADAPHSRFCLVLRAVGRQALRADCLGPPVFFSLPLLVRPRFARTPRFAGFRAVGFAPQNQRTLRLLRRGGPLGRLSPPSSETGGCGRSVSFRSP